MQNSVSRFLLPRSALLAVSLTAGVVMGIINIHRADAMPCDIDFIALCFVLALFRPSFFAVPPLVVTGCVYLLHVFAIAQLGYKQPFVEKDVESALACVGFLYPTFIGAAVGATIGGFLRWAVHQLFTSRKASA